MTFPKPSVREKRASRPIARRAIKRKMPDCICEHACKRHAATLQANEDGGFTVVRSRCSLCPCGRYVQKVKPPRRSARSSPLKRGTGKPARAKRKLMPKCKHCAHPYSKHAMYTCKRCAACPGYEPAIGIRQKRRTPKAAIRDIADALWSKLLKLPKVCEVQRFYPHTCEMGLQAMHGIPRTFSATRWLPLNGFAGCAGAHKFFTDRPELWSAVLLDAWGEPVFRELWAKARAMQPVDMDATVACLRAELARLEFLA